MGWLQNKFEKNFLITTVDYVFNWARKSAVWPMTFGLACCAIEMIASSTARFDIARFGSEVFRPSPRQSDLMIVAGTVTLKMAPVLKRLYDQMPEPKWVISMGACSSVGGPFNTYAVLQGVDKIVPVDVYVTGCPPRPENLFYARPVTVVSLRTAYWSPVLLADVRSRALAAVHAGCRGPAAEIVIQTLHRLRDIYGTDPKDVFAVIGPGIGACCYQVGEDVA